MSRIINAISAVLMVLALTGGAHAQPLSALARVDTGASRITDSGGVVEVSLALSQAVPFRLRHVNDPYRLVADFNEALWPRSGLGAINRSARVTELRAGALQPGWSRLVLELTGPLVVAQAALRPYGPGAGQMLAIRLEPATPAEFSRRARAVPVEDFWDIDTTAFSAAPLARQDGTRPLQVVLDPGHGGIDPGAERGGVVEADLMLTFARELAELLRREGVEVALTRNEDIFVPLEARMSIARAARADLFVSLHADVVAEGVATGATVYTLAESASDEAAQKLAERHDRADLLAGVDLTRKSDEIAHVLMDMARTDNTPRSNALAGALVDGLRDAVGRLHKRPHQKAVFSVLKAPDIPSVLIELGFMSSPRDLENLIDPEWRTAAAGGIRDAILVWAREDAARAKLLRQ